MDWEKTTTRGYKQHLSFGIWCDLCKRFYGNSGQCGDFNNLDLNRHVVELNNIRNATFADVQNKRDTYIMQLEFVTHAKT